MIYHRQTDTQRQRQRKTKTEKERPTETRIYKRQTNTKRQRKTETEKERPTDTEKYNHRHRHRQKEPSLYLHSSFAELQPQGEVLSGEHVRVLSLLERSLQLVQLVRGVNVVRLLRIFLCRLTSSSAVGAAAATAAGVLPRLQGCSARAGHSRWRCCPLLRLRPRQAEPVPPRTQWLRTLPGEMESVGLRRWRAALGVRVRGRGRDCGRGRGRVRSGSEPFRCVKRRSWTAEASVRVCCRARTGDRDLAFCTGWCERGCERERQRLQQVVSALVSIIFVSLVVSACPPAAILPELFFLLLWRRRWSRLRWVPVPVVVCVIVTCV